MTAREIPVGGRFAWAGCEYTVTHQIPGDAHMTYVTYGDNFGRGSVIAKRASAFFGDMEVVALPDASAAVDAAKEAK
jgi:hypothetical protein